MVYGINNNNTINQRTYILTCISLSITLTQALSQHTHHHTPSHALAYTLSHRHTHNHTQTHTDTYTHSSSSIMCNRSTITCILACMALFCLLSHSTKRTAFRFSLYRFSLFFSIVAVLTLSTLS